MANFPQHLGYGLTVSAIAAGAGYFQFGLTPAQTGAAFLLGAMSSLAPDLDHPEGVPGQILAEILTALAPIAFILYLPLEYKNRLALEHWIIFFVITLLTVKHLYFFLITRLTVHRGIFHSIPAAIVCGEIVFLLFPHLPFSNRWVMAAISTVGYLTHLILDEIYSVQWDKLEVKKSLGTALDIGNFRNLSTWLIYILVVTLGWWIWHSYDPANPVSSLVRELIRR